VPHYFAAVTFISDNLVQTARQRATDGSPPPPQTVAPYPIVSVPYLAHMVRSQQPITLDNTRHPNRWKYPRLTRALRAYLGAPIIREGTVIGFIELYSHRGETYTSSHVQRLRIFADQAAIAINNARLHEQAQQYAALMERQRLARDLHDAINQTLFSASVIAEALPRVIERTPDRAEQLALELNRLTRGALSEMRSLLVELRPESIEKASLAELLPQLCEAFSARTWSQVAQHIVQTKPLPPDVKEVFYRIAQEALSNITKHARATDVLLKLSEDGGRVEMCISDNGRGFDNDQSEASYGFGLAIMRERAESINASFDVRSQPGQGTEVRLVWHFPE
jgi:signal transduction histidine kinase